MTRRWPLIGAVLAVLWLFVRGVTLDPVNIAQELVIGAGVGVPVAYALRRMYSRELALAGTVAVVPYALLYVVFFLYELLTANLDVARRVLAPSMPIDPAVVEVPLRVESPVAITTIANSITLTPGTLTMDYDPESNALYVHSIAGGQDREGVVEPIRRWEDYALVVFDERLNPGDPVPTVARERRADGGAGAGDRAGGSHAGDGDGGDRSDGGDGGDRSDGGDGGDRNGGDGDGGDGRARTDGGRDRPDGDGAGRAADGGRRTAVSRGDTADGHPDADDRVTGPAAAGSGAAGSHPGADDGGREGPADDTAGSPGGESRGRD